MKKTITAFLFLAVSSYSLFAAEMRQHFAVVNGGDRFEVTRIERHDPNVVDTTVLVRDAVTQRIYRLESNRNYEAQTFDLRMTDVEAPKLFVAIHFKLPFTATSLKETKAEFQAPDLRSRAVGVRLSAPGGSIEKSEKEWHSAAAASAKTTLLRELPSAFQGAIDRLQNVAIVPELNEFCADFLGYFATTPDCRLTSKVRLETLPPDCAFDAKYGQPCSTAQLQQAKAVRTRGHGRFY
jgi:hypothetical protein